MMLFMSLPEFDMYMPLKGIDLTTIKKKKILKENSRLQWRNWKINKKLLNKGFVIKAPEAVVNKEREKLKDYESLLQSAIKSWRDKRGYYDKKVLFSQEQIQKRIDDLAKKKLIIFMMESL